MKTSDLVFIGINGSVVALNGATGEQVWVKQVAGGALGGAGAFVNVVLQSGALLATCRGEVFCLDPLTGNPRWHNPLKGYGLGLAAIATDSTTAASAAALLAGQHGQDQAAASQPVMT